MSTARPASLPTIKRLPSYLQIIENARDDGREFISGTVIADELELEPIQVRKDLAVTGIVGKPRVGFSVSELIEAISAFLHWNKVNRSILLGAGHLGTALMGYSEFRRHGLSIIAAFDPSPERHDLVINETRILPMDDLDDFIRREQPEIAILTVPSSVAQQTADQVIAAGVRSLWNFTNVKLKVPAGVVVQKEDLSSGYAVLSVKMGLAAHSAECSDDPAPLPGGRTSTI
ncbi:redox-sensing transcriptional repressor Rex [Spirochaeta africana]|uniref:Redox-sensing transcriptional repressor Rex n=1 Tax=Spirochaeta africana (strain ATCC 700263 / DSM 8902 / Z-7692) TaxID=889378 RepID=H9UKC9_SPIAZ|nr:redox-sensing transcriptional repressor Rex [Spirochaeta africana]AFG37972.1 AT-rich DNA-binding protein [Spirochaeta africana DSM 8902]